MTVSVRGPGVLSTETNLDLGSLLDARHMVYILDNTVVASIFGSLLLLLFFSCSAPRFGGRGSRPPFSLWSSSQSDSVTWVSSTGFPSRYLRRFWYSS